MKEKSLDTVPAEMPPSYMDALMVDVEKTMAAHIGDDALGIQLRNYCSYYFRRVLSMFTCASREECLQYANEYLADENGVVRVLSRLWVARDCGAIYLTDELEKLTPDKWLRFLAEWDCFYFYCAGSVYPTSLEGRIQADISPNELQRFLFDIVTETDIFRDDVTVLASLHAAYQIDQSRLEDDVDGVMMITGFWDSEKSIKELRDDLGPRRSVFDTILSLQKNAALAAKANGAKLDVLAGKANAVIDELAQWRKWIAQLKKPGNHKDAPPLAAKMQRAVVDAWGDYRTECTKEKVRATFQGFLDQHGSDEIYTTATGKSYQLIQLAPDEKTLKDIVHNAQSKDSARNKRAKSCEKSNSRQKRNRK